VIDKKCSRHQVEVTINEQDKSVVMTPRGPNPSYLTKVGRVQQQTCVLFLLTVFWQPTVCMDRDVAYVVGDSDIFTLLLDKYPYTIHIEQQTQSHKQSKSNSKPKQQQQIQFSPQKKGQSEQKAGESPAKPQVKSEPKSNPQKEAKLKPQKEAKPKQQKPAKTANLSAKKKSKSSEEEENEPDEYDLNDEFIDDGSAPTQSSNLHHKRANSDEDQDWSVGEEDEDEVVKEGRAFMKREGMRLKRKYNDEAPGDKPVCKYGATCYRTNSDHVAEFYHPPKAKETQPKSHKQTHSQSEDNEEDKVSNDLIGLSEAFKEIDKSVIKAIYFAADKNFDKALEQLLQMGEGQS